MMIHYTLFIAKLTMLKEGGGVLFNGGSASVIFAAESEYHYTNVSSADAALAPVSLLSPA